MDCASTILPITPPAELAAHIRTGSSPSCCDVIRCRLPNSAFDEVSLPVSATPNHPRNVPKKGNSHPVRVNANPSTAPATIAAKKHPVPVAESQLKSYRAASGVSLVTTGAARVTARCRKGTSQTGVVALFIAPLTLGRPHTSTKTERMANGIQALTI